jgi:hypothetical protein
MVHKTVVIFGQCFRSLGHELAYHVNGLTQRVSNVNISINCQNYRKCIHSTLIIYSVCEERESQQLLVFFNILT